MVSAGRWPALGIVADDLTGAGDCAVKFAESGWAAEIALDADAARDLVDGMAVAIVTDARDSSEPDAARRTRSAVEALARSDARLLYLKIDSTLRGTVAAQIAGALAGLSLRAPDAFALVCPAYPAMGRTISGGRLLVHGGTPDGHYGGVPALPGALSVALGAGAAADEAARLRALATDSRLLLIDAASDADLDRVAAVAAELGPRALLVGSAGLAAALARRHSGAAPVAPAPRARSTGIGAVVVAASSRHPIVAAQLAALGDDVVLVTAPIDDVIVDGERSERAAAAALAAAVERIVSAGDVGALVLVGGDGALAVLSRLGARALRIAHAIVEGAPAGTVRGGALDGVTVVTKSGGFGGPETLAAVVDLLTQPQNPGMMRSK